MYCIYHKADLDGICSAAIVKKRFPDAKLIGHDYGLPFDLDPQGEMVVMCDISLPMQQMEDLARKSRWNFTWIDHHISAIKAFDDFASKGESFCRTYLNVNKAGCELTWEAMFGEEKMPWVVEMLGTYDVWRNDDKEKWDNVVMPVQYAVRAACNKPEDFPAHFLDAIMPPSDCIRLIDQGKSIMGYLKIVWEKECRDKAFEIKLDGLRAICLNGGNFNSQVFESLYDPAKHDLMIPFQMVKGKFWSISFYTTKDDVDCSEIAKKYGGGGHKKAAGCQIENINQIIK